MSRDWQFIIIANAVCFVWFFRKGWFEAQREYVIKYVRRWDREMREEGFVISKIDVHPRLFYFRARAKATWKSADGAERCQEWR